MGSMSHPNTAESRFLELRQHKMSPFTFYQPPCRIVAPPAVFDLVDRDGGGTVTKEELGELVRVELTVETRPSEAWG